MTIGVVAQSLNDIIKYNVRALVRRFHLNRDWIIGLIGDRGSGKSLGGSNIAIRDFMMNGEPCWSNMQMKLNVAVSDGIARYYGNPQGGIITYQSEYLEKEKFIYLDSRYEGGVLFFDEFNLEYGEARRSASNVNLMTDRAVQQLRKIQCGLVYTVINEMYMDPRVRENTDVFIRCQDVALNPHNLSNRMEQGRVFEWLVYPMTARVAGNGNTFKETKKPVGPIRITLGDMWGSIDTYERQAVGQRKYTETKSLTPVELKEESASIIEKDKWSWLYSKIEEFYKKHIDDGDYIEIASSELRREFGVSPEMWGSVVRKIRGLIKGIETRGKGNAVNPTIYTIPNRVLV